MAFMTTDLLSLSIWSIALIMIILTDLVLNR
jgi:hypothetical protein